MMEMVRCSTREWFGHLEGIGVYLSKIDTVSAREKPSITKLRFCQRSVADGC